MSDNPYEKETFKENPAGNVEKEFSGPAWKHPAVVYIVLSTGVFLFLLLLGYIGYNSGCVPVRTL